MKRSAIFAVMALLSALSGLRASTPFVCHGAPDKFLDLEVHALIGGSTVIQNYGSCFPQVSELDVNQGFATGVGAAAQFGFTDFIYMGVEANLLVNNYRMSLAVADDNATSITNCFLKNRYYTANFPVYVSLKFNLGQTVRWNVDAGVYYTYGLSGRSSVTLYSARVNPLGQLITTVTGSKENYYNSPDAFICSSYRGDIGLHLATGFTIKRHVSVGFRTQIGIKNQAHAYNAITTPQVHNVNFLCVVGYHF